MTTPALLQQSFQTRTRVAGARALAQRMLGEPHMKLSASYVYEGKVIAIVKGERNADVKLEVAPGNVLAASIPNEELERLALRPGMTARASVRARQIQLPRP